MAEIRRFVNAGYSTCPICDRHWLVTPADDCCLPACGCFGDDASATNPARPCEKCDLDHMAKCQMSAPAAGAVPRAESDDPDVILDRLREMVTDRTEALIVIELLLNTADKLVRDFGDDDEIKTLCVYLDSLLAIVDEMD